MRFEPTTTGKLCNLNFYNFVDFSKNTKKRRTLNPLSAIFIHAFMYAFTAVCCNIQLKIIILNKY